MKCKICHKTEFTELFPQLCTTHNYICHNCGLVQIPINESDELKNYYKEDGYFKKSPNYSLRKIFFSKSMLIKTGRKRINEMIEIMNYDFSGKKLLDIGCGYGELLYVLKNEHNAEVYGIEPSRETAEIGSKVFDINIKDCLLEEYKTSMKFDFIMLNHTLEHTDDPTSFLLKIIEFLKNTGILYIEVPNIMCPSGGFELNTFLYNEHLQTFSANNLNLLIKRVGLSTITYDKKYFLKFYTTKKPKNKTVNIIEINYQEILDFLRKYKSDYNLLQSMKVYFHKGLYLADLLIHKLGDMIWK